jgi:hypothetical protein
MNLVPRCKNCGEPFVLFVFSHRRPEVGCLTCGVPDDVEAVIRLAAELENAATSILGGPDSGQSNIKR